MSAKYKAVSAAASVTWTTGDRVYEEVYRVPAGFIAKLTFVHTVNSPHLYVSSDGGTTKLSVLIPSSDDKNFVDWGIYFNEGDILYIASETQSGTKRQIFLCLILENQEADNA